MSTEKPATKEELEVKLSKLQAGLLNPAISGNAGLLASTKKRISIIENEIANFTSASKPKKEPVAKVAKVKKEKPVKVAKEKKEKVVKEKKPVKEVVTQLTKKEISDLKSNPKIAKILEIVFPKHLVQYKLHLLKLNTEEIMALTGSPKPATIRNIWYYTSGKKSL